MKILALWGKGSKGKTTTLNRLSELLSNGFTTVGKSKHPITLPADLEEDNCYIVGCNGKKIGITTRGDTKEALEKDFEWLKNSNSGEDCDLYICASRSKGATVSFIESQVGDGDIYWVSKTTISQETKNGYVTPPFVEAQQNNANEKQAESLVGLIDEMIQKNII